MSTVVKRSPLKTGRGDGGRGKGVHATNSTPQAARLPADRNSSGSWDDSSRGRRDPPRRRRRGGRRDPGDADLRATAIRETMEEVGVDLSGAERLGVLDDLYPRTPVLPPVVVRPFVFALTSRPTIVVGPEEVQEAFWVSFRALQAPAARGEVIVDHPGIPRQVLPAYTLGNRTIWGMSERILTPLISLVS